MGPARRAAALASGRRLAHGSSGFRDRTVRGVAAHRRLERAGFAPRRSRAPSSPGVPTVMSEPTEPTYDAATIALHWLTAALAIALWVIGQTADWAPRGPLRTGYWSVHVVFGFLLAIVLAIRIVWRGAGGGRRLAGVGAPMLRFLATATHHALYALLLIVVALGIVNAFLRGYNLFDLFHLPQLGDPALRRPVTGWHGLAANILLGLASFHAAAALLHHYVMRDGVLRRMAPALRR